MENYPLSDEVKWQVLADQFRLEHTPEDEEAYFRKKIKRIIKGDSVWMIRNFDSPGQYYDYYVDKVAEGAVHVGEDTWGYEAYYGNEASENFVSLGQAVEAVEEYTQSIGES